MKAALFRGSTYWWEAFPGPLSRLSHQGSGIVQKSLKCISDETEGSGVDRHNQGISDHAVAADPVDSRAGKLVIECFRRQCDELGQVGGISSRLGFEVAGGWGSEIFARGFMIPGTNILADVTAVNP